MGKNIITIIIFISVDNDISRYKSNQLHCTEAYYSVQANMWLCPSDVFISLTLKTDLYKNLLNSYNLTWHGCNCQSSLCLQCPSSSLLPLSSGAAHLGDDPAHQAHLLQSTPGYICPGCAASHRQFVLVTTLVDIRPRSPRLLSPVWTSGNPRFCLLSSSCAPASPSTEELPEPSATRPPASPPASAPPSSCLPASPLRWKDSRSHQNPGYLLCPTLNKHHWTHHRRALCLTLLWGPSPPSCNVTVTLFQQHE